MGRNTMDMLGVCLRAALTRLWLVRKERGPPNTTPSKTGDNDNQSPKTKPNQNEKGEKGRQAGHVSLQGWERKKKDWQARQKKKMKKMKQKKQRAWRVR